MEDLIYTVNIDYEFALYDPEYYQNKSLYERFNKEFEYLFLWMEDKDKKLSNIQSYPNTYLETIQKWTGSLPQLTKEKPTRNWWGALTDIELEKKINSKITSTKISIANNWSHPKTKILDSQKSLKNYLDNSEYDQHFVKDPYSFSGIGNFILQKHSKTKDYIYTLIKNHPIIIEPFLNVIRAFGTICLDNKQFFIIQNITNPRGQFMGALWISKLAEESDIKEKIEKIIPIYRNLGWSEVIQIDSFFYLEKGKLNYYPLVEVNARKSMGLFLKFMTRFVPPTGVGLWIILKKENLKARFKLNELLYSTHSKTGIIQISPDQNSFQSFFITETSLRTLQYLIKKLWNRVSKKHIKLPTYYHIYPHI